ncbi:type IIL restriction-modification enzyme MmeI [Ponticoccus litoralis]|uniref:Type IIL restriction-modification enzyme MmeI n=1 Tax=Ponticoccus litoralis TaxID=422297 RepID=A0AAW9SF12_9RHOB
MIHSQEWQEALWDKFVRAAPRTVTRQAICKANLPRGHARRQSSNTAIASFDRGAEPGTRDQSEDSFGVFLPLAGISTVEQSKESAFDIKATGRLNRHYVALL